MMEIIMSIASYVGAFAAGFGVASLYWSPEIQQKRYKQIWDNYIRNRPDLK